GQRKGPARRRGLLSSSSWSGDPVGRTRSGARLRLRLEPARPFPIARLVLRRPAAAWHRRTRRALRRRLAITGPDRLTTDQRPDLLGGQRLVFEQALGHDMKLVEVLGQDLARCRLAFLDQPADLLVDDAGGDLGDVLALGHRVPEEGLFLVVAVAQRTELFAEAELGDHAAGPVRGLA